MPEITGRLIPARTGLDLRLVRSLALPIDEAWEYLTDPHLTAEWFGSWEGDGRPGGGIRIIMKFEEGEPAVLTRVKACDAPHHLALHTVDEYGSWDLELRLEADGDDDTLLHFTHHLDGDTAEVRESVGDIGPGWEYYLDKLVAATEGAESVFFEEYYPSLRDGYLTL